MIQDISPRIFSNAFAPRPPGEGDYVVIYGNENVYLTDDGALPHYEQLGYIASGCRDRLIFLFAIDKTAFYFAESSMLTVDEAARLTEKPSRYFRTYKEKWVAFAVITACHLAGWYERRRLCGKCGAVNRQSDKERALECPDCGAVYYPRISPAVIVGVTDGDKLLLTRYADRPWVNSALVAGFCEIGETAEDTVRREVMEEVGLKVKNIRYYKSQPWGISGSLLFGFYCDLDGDGDVTLDRNELAVAEWTPRASIPPTDASISLTAEMIEGFRLGINTKGTKRRLLSGEYDELLL